MERIHRLARLILLSWVAFGSSACDHPSTGPAAASSVANTTPMVLKSEVFSGPAADSMLAATAAAWAAQGDRALTDFLASPAWLPPNRTRTGLRPGLSLSVDTDAEDNYPTSSWAATVIGDTTNVTMSGTTALIASDVIFIGTHGSNQVTWSESYLDGSGSIVPTTTEDVDSGMGVDILACLANPPVSIAVCAWTSHWSTAYHETVANCNIQVTAKAQHRAWFQVPAMSMSSDGKFTMSTGVGLILKQSDFYNDAGQTADNGSCAHPVAHFSIESDNGLGAFDGGTLTVTVSASAGSANINFDGGRSTKGGASIISYQWYLDGTAYSSALSGSSAVSVGTHTLSLTVTDAHGYTSSASATLNIQTPMCESSELEDGPSYVIDCSPPDDSGGGGSDGGGSGSCSTEWIELDISYDGGITWGVWWEGYATVCDKQT